MEMTKKKLKKLKKGEVSDIGECGGEMEMLKDENILEKEGGNVKRGQGNTKKTNKKKSRGNLEGKDVDKEAEVEGEDVDSSRNVADEEGDATGRKDYVKAQESKKNVGNVEGTRERTHGEVGDVGGREHFKVDKNVVAEKAHKKKKKKEKDNKNGGSGHQLTKHSVEDVSEATGDRIKNVEIVDRGQELDRGLVDKAEKKKKKKDKDNKKKSDFDYQFLEQGLQNGKIAETGVLDGCLAEKVVKKKRKRENKKNEVEVNLGVSEDITNLTNNATQQLENTSTRGLETDVACDKNVMKKSRKKQRTRDQGKEMNGSGSSQVIANSTGNEKGNGRKRKKPNSLENGSQDAKPGKQKKNVRFSDHVEVFPLSDHEQKLVQGKRFSHEEDEIVRNAVYEYIKAHNLGDDEGLKMVLNCRAHLQVRNCWKEIAMAIPYRPKVSVYYRAQTLFKRAKTTKWTEEEYEMVKEYQKKHGNQWKPLADELHKHRVHVKDTWRRIKLSNMKKGHWNQEEYQGLFDLVNLDLKLRLKEEKKSKYGMLRDNISFCAISDKLSTRTDAMCCLKWYKQLTSSMVAEGEWADSDDYRLITALYELDASCIEDVDWDCLLEHRFGDLCRKRWNQMALHIGYHGTRSFSEQVDVLAKRYCPDLMEVREAWDSKPVVD